MSPDPGPLRPPTFASYDLTAMPLNGVHGLSAWLLPQMAARCQYPLDIMPNEASLKEFIKLFGTDKQLRRNIDLVRALIGADQRTMQLAADWLGLSGLGARLDRSFVSPEFKTPDAVGVAIITGGIARWMMRRQTVLIGYIKAGGWPGAVILTGGSRPVEPDEHDYASAYLFAKGKLMTEFQFLESFIAPPLQALGMQVHLVEVDSQRGADVMAAAADKATDIYDSQFTSPLTVLMVSNAFAGIVQAGQLRQAFRSVSPDFDGNGSQLFLQTDPVKLALDGEPPESGKQDVWTALQLILMSALQIFRAQQTLWRD